ncbi:helix-turn-helix domain-containing protein [Methanobrevibacter sp.]|uniref:helix-turn-helix domain-containing protein n=1 Tax=Methanobrevibacter sp. TaxID=66852 RepID=UPI00262EB95A|nr:helix-turn-helix transcriptional regulator [uncultured Methanobrevibacter sp.]
MEKKIGARIKKLREDSKYTQEQIASYLEINQGHLSKIESGDRKLNLKLLDKLCSLYNCSHEYILLKSDEYSIPKVAFRNNENFVDLNLIAKMNQLIGNLKFLRSLDNEE